MSSYKHKINEREDAVEREVMQEHQMHVPGVGKEESAFALPTAIRSESTDDRVGNIADRQRRSITSGVCRSVARRGGKTHQRTKSEGEATRFVVVSEAEESDVSEDSTDARPAIKRLRKRGRPPTTGEYVGLKEAAQEAINKLKEKHDLERQVEAITYAGEPPAPSRGSMPLPEEEELHRQMRERPTADLGSEVLQHLKEVEIVAAKSTNLKGPFVRKLRMAAMSVRAAVTELAKRTQITDSIHTVERDNADLRMRVNELEAQIARLNAQKTPSAAADTAVPTIAATPPENEQVVEVVVHRSASPILDVEVPMANAKPQTEDGATGSRQRRHPTAETEDALFSRIGKMVDDKLTKFLAGLAPALPTAGKPSAVDKRRREADLPTSRVTSVTAETPKKKRKPGDNVASGVGNEEHYLYPTEGSATRKSAVEKRTTVKPTVGKTDTGKTTAGKRIDIEGSAPSEPQVSWNQVVGRKSKKKDQGVVPVHTPATPRPGGSADSASAAKKKKSGQQQTPAKVRLSRAPRTSAVTVTVPPDAKLTYGEAMVLARQKINLQDVGVEAMRTRRAITGGWVFEIPGPESSAKAATLASKMSEVLADTGVKVANPTKRAEIRIRGLDDSVTAKEVASAVAGAAGCPENEVRVGQIRSTSSFMGTIWVQCPLVAARKLVSLGRVTIGWCSARVEPLAPRQLQCYRCLEFGHTRSRCINPADRTGRCYRCGDTSHTAGTCTSAPRCPVCTDLGRKADHRLGGPGCNPKSTRQRMRRAAASTEKDSSSAPALGPAGAEKLPAVGGKKSTTTAGKLPTAVQEDGGLEEAMIIDHLQP